MISSDPKLPSLSPSDRASEFVPTTWLLYFIERFYQLWRELVREIQGIRNDIYSGTYTPTLSNTTNVAASTAYVCQYMVVGKTVTVSGRVDIDVTTTATDTVLGISLPIASAFANNGECAGMAVQDIGGAVKECGYIRADTTNDRAYLGLQSVGVSNYAWYFTFTYQIL